MTDKPLTIIELRAENIKRLTVVSIRPDGKLVQITGKNGAGKTSVLDSIYWALGGTAGIQEQPINDASQEALIRLDMGEFKVTRHFRRTAIDRGGDGSLYTTRLTVEAADGSKFPSPQTMLDDMIGELSFDPLAFTRLKPKEQFDALKVFVTAVDIDLLDRQNLTDYEQRTSENRKAKELEAQAAGISVTVLDASGLPAQPVDEEALVAELEAAGEKNAEIEKRRGRRHQAQNDIALCESIADKAEERIRELQASIEKIRAEGAAAREKGKGIAERLARADPLPAEVDTSTITERIRVAREANESHRKAVQRAELLAQAERHAHRSRTLTDAMDARTAHKMAAVAAAQMPVEGLSFGEGEILFAGRPFSQASDAEKLRVSTAVAMSFNPKIRVLRIRDGSLLDSDGMKLLEELCEKHGFQCWIERVDDSGKVGVVMEDGHVVAR